jgi:hypothetical protein
MITIVTLAINTSGFKSARIGSTTKSVVAIKGTTGFFAVRLSNAARESLTIFRAAAGMNAARLGREIKIAVKAALIQFWS